MPQAALPEPGPVFERLLDHHGPQAWWPAEGRFEILVGAVLTQNTSWTNVERALASLAQTLGRGDPATIEAGDLLALSSETLAEAIRPSGYFNVKTRYLTALAEWFEAAGGFPALDRWETERLRRALLAVKGIGPETADDILLYAFDRPIFVIDAYTRRLFTRLGGCSDRHGYEAWRAWFEARLTPEPGWLGECHALVVAHAKDTCTARVPRCHSCVLAADCAFARTATAAP